MSVLKTILISVAVVLVLVVVLAGVGFTILLSNFGLAPRQAFEVYREQQRVAAAIHNAEAPIDSPDAVSDAGFVNIGGIEQWITIRGKNRKNPALLFLHGGPGDAQSQLAYIYRRWEESFKVVQWDQRGAGRTYGRNGSATPDMTLERIIEDGLEVAEHVRTRLGKRKVILVGHSWGSVLGVSMVMRRPELFSAYVGTGQIVSWAGQMPQEYAYTLARLEADHEEDGIKDLSRLGPPPYRTLQEDERMRKWLNRYLPDADKTYLLASVMLAMRNSKYSLKDVQDKQTGHLSFSLPRMHSIYSDIDLNVLSHQIPIPFFVIDGREDRITPPELAADYLQKIAAPQKGMELIDGAGHFAVMSHSEEFLRILLAKLGPIADTSRTE